jgi:CRP-like cAMP-binding protein
MHLGALPPAFAGLDPADSQEASSFLQPASLESGDLLMEQGEEDFTLAFIISGSVSFMDGDLRIGGATSREMIGEVELFGQMPRMATVVAAAPTHLLVLAHEHWLELCERGNPAVYNIERFAHRRVGERLRHLAEGIAERSLGEQRTPIPPPRRTGFMDKLSTLFGGNRTPTVNPELVLANSPAFNWAPSEVLAQIAPFFRAERFPAGTMAARYGEVGDRAWIVVDGEVDLLIPVGGGAEMLATVAAGHAFGDAGVLQGAPRPLSALCRSDVLALYIGKEQLAELFSAQDPAGSVFRQAMLRNLIDELMAMQRRFVSLERRHAGVEQDALRRTPVATVWRD